MEVEGREQVKGEPARWSSCRQRAERNAARPVAVEGREQARREPNTRWGRHRAKKKAASWAGHVHVEAPPKSDVQNPTTMGSLRDENMVIIDDDSRDAPSPILMGGHPQADALMGHHDAPLPAAPAPQQVMNARCSSSP